MIEIKKMIEEHSECLSSAIKLKGFLTDLYPAIEYKSKIKALVYAYQSDIVTEINNNEMDDFFINKMRKKIVDQFSIERKAAEWAVKQWCAEYGSGIIGKPYNSNSDSTCKESNSEDKANQTIKLTLQQQKAVNSDSRRIAVIAGPGSGKTCVLTERICSLVKDKGVKEDEILALSYSSKAAKEVRKRLKEKLGNQFYKISALTFHSFGLQIIRNNFNLLGYTHDFDIINGPIKNQILRKLLKENFINEKEISQYSQTISRIKNGGNTRNKHIEEIYNNYNKELKNINAIDFDDMILLPIRLFTKHPEICEKYKDTFSHILIDEVQDLNEYQTELIHLLQNENTSLFVVGDDDQCIYEWRGAKPDYLKNLVNGNSIEVIKLEDNFRSDSVIVNLSDSLIVHNIKRIKKMMLPQKSQMPKLNMPLNTAVGRRFFSQEGEADYIANEIFRLVDEGIYNYNDFAVLVRKSQQVEPIIHALEKKNVPYFEQVTEEPKYDDFIQVLYTISNFKRNNGINKAVNFPVKVLDNFAYTEVLDKFGISGNLPISQVFEIINNNGEEFEDSEIFRSRYRLIKDLNSEIAKISVSDVIERLYNLYLSEPFASSKKVKDKLLHIENMLDVAKEFDAIYETSNSAHFAIQDFLDYINLSAQDESSNDCAESAVNLLTCHKSKGLEFPVVFIPGVQVGVFPNDYFTTTNEELEAERRLFYVSMTRAINKLYITCYDDPIKGSGIIKKGFLAEIPGIKFQEALK